MLRHLHFSVPATEPDPSVPGLFETAKGPSRNPHLSKLGPLLTKLLTCYCCGPKQ